MKRKYTLSALLGIIMAIASIHSADAHCAGQSSYKDHRGPYSKGQLYGMHRCAAVIHNYKNMGKRCRMSVTPDGLTFCE